MDTTRVDRSLAAALAGKLQAMFDSMVQDTALLVRTPSVVGHEGPAQALMADLYRRLGLRVEQFETDYDEVRHHPAYCAWREEPGIYAGRPNVIGIWEGAPAGGERPRSLVLNGHIDTVSAEPLSAWTRDPFGAEVAGGRMYGRGVNDMKSGLIAAAYAVQAIRECGVRPRGTVILQSVIEEEAGGGGGTLACLQRGYTGDAFIAVEPTGGHIRIANSGILYFRVRTAGRTAHAGNAHLGVNAMRGITRIADALFALDEQRGREVHYPLFETGSGGRSCHLSLGRISGGDWPSTVCGWAELEGRLSFVPGETMAGIKQTVERTVHEAVAGDRWFAEHPPVVEWFGWRCEPYCEDTSHPFLGLLREVAQGALGRPVEFVGRASGVDSRFAHLFGAPGVCFGTAGANNHGADEYTELDRLVPTALALALTTLAWCGVAQG